MTPEEPTPLSAGQIGPFLRSTIRSGERLTMADVDEIERAIAARATVPAVDEDREWLERILTDAWVAHAAHLADGGHVGWERWYADALLRAGVSTGAATSDRERLAALSAAASRGSWHIAIAVGDSRAGVVDDAGRDVVGFRATRENAEFIVALVNSFRASTGAATPDRERLREALVFIADWARDCAHPEDTASGYGFATIEKMARAALAPVETPRPEDAR